MPAPIDQADYRTWEPYLTPELRAHFERAGETIVEFDVTHHNYHKEEKHFAALFWLAQRRDAKKSIATRRFHLIFWVALAGLVVALVGIAVAKGWL